ncbi:MAG: hypothetical protein V4488_16350 [Pseudomonadota bacterium]
MEIQSADGRWKRGYERRTMFSLLAIGWLYPPVAAKPAQKKCPPFTQKAWGQLFVAVKIIAGKFIQGANVPSDSTAQGPVIRALIAFLVTKDLLICVNVRYF